MKKLLTLLLLLHYFINTSKASNEITVTYPNTQDIIFNVNSIYPILWDSDNSLPVNSEVEILLSINNGKDYFIKLGISLNDGVELIRVPISFAKSSKCRIKIRSFDNQSFSDESDASFTINATKWEFLIDNADSVRVPQNDILSNLELYAYHMRPFKKWNYEFKNTGSINTQFYHHQQITAPFGCVFENSLSSYHAQPLSFIISKNGNYRFAHTKSNGTNNFNTVNVFNNENPNSCLGLISSSSTKYFVNNSPVQRFSSGVLSSLVRGNIYQIRPFNNFLFDDIFGFLEIFESSVRNAQYYEVQIPQPSVFFTVVVLDSALSIRQVSVNNGFMTLPPGTYKIIVLSHPQNFDVSILINQKLTDINFNSQSLFISENVKILEITPKCPSNLSLNNTFHGTLKEAVHENIISNQQVINSSNINYQAGKSIILEPGFFINRPNLFKAEIKTCQ